MKRITKILIIIYSLIVVLFLLDNLVGFDIKSQFLKSFVYYGFLIGTPIILLWNLFSIKAKTKRIIWTIYPTIFLIFIFIVNPMQIVFSSGAWKTQTILYQNKHLTFKKVEFQIQDIGALGYSKRTVEVIHLTPLFMLTREVPNDIEKRDEWMKVERDVNELGLKEP